jgi:hypothetical protein
MALILKDRVQETSTTTGTGTLTLAGAVTQFQTFSSAVGNGNTTYYTIYNAGGSDWEVGIGTVGAGTLARTTVLASSNANALVNFTGTLYVFGDYPAGKAAYLDASGVINNTTFNATTSVITPIVQATNSGGLALKNSAGTTQISMGAGGGDNASINVSTNLNGTNAQIDISPTGTGHVHINPTGSGSIEINPTSLGTINNMSLGATTAAAAKVTTLNIQSGLTLAALPGTSGQVLTSAGTGAVPTWTTPATGTVTSVSATAPVTSSGGNTPNIAMPAATTSVSGYLTSTDWTTFNNKGSGTVTSITAGTGLSGGTITGTGTIALANTTVTAGAYTSANITVDAQGRITAAASGSGSLLSAVTGTAPISVVTTLGTANVSISQATTSTNGYLSSTDWNTFNGKGVGTVTSVAATVPSFLSVSGSPITSSGTLALSYSGTALPVANGGTGSTTLTANNVLLGNGTSALQAVAPGTSGNVLTSDGTTWTSAAVSGGSAITLISTQTANNTSTFLTFTNIGTYKQYILIISNLTDTNSSSNDWFLQYGTGATPTWQTSSYEWASNLARTTSQTTTSSSSDSGIVLTRNGTYNAYGATGKIVLGNLSNTTVYKCICNTIAYSDYTGTWSNLSTTGTWSGGTSAITAIRIKGTSNFVSGTASLYGFSS